MARRPSDNPVWTKEAFSRARPARELLAGLVGARNAADLLRPRGRPKSPHSKVAISLRIAPEVLARWKASGAGWQTRMAEVLKSNLPDRREGR